MLQVKNTIIKSAKILTIICMMAASSAVYADSHIKTIREDRYWRYLCFGIGYCEELVIKFDGTMERFGKEYHVFKDASLPGYDTRSDELSINCTLLREEDGRVYVANNSYGLDEKYREDTEYADYESEEFLLFDFNCSEGDYMPSVINKFKGDIRYGNYSDLVFFPSQNQITKIENIDIDGEICKKYSFGISKCYDEELQWPDLIEGIGFLNNGILSLPMFLWLPAGGPCYNIEFSGLYDGDGNRIYPKPNVGVNSPEADNAVIISLEGDKILISAESGSFDVSVCTIEGKSMRNYHANDSLTISKADLGKGIYLLTVKSGNSTDTRKIIV